MIADDINLGGPVAPLGVAVYKDPIDGLFAFKKVKRVAGKNQLRATVRDKVTKEVISGYFSKSAFVGRRTIRIKILGESKDLYQICFDSDLNSFGFMPIAVWVSKGMVWIVTGIHIHGFIDYGLGSVYCGRCSTSLVWANRYSHRSFAFCPSCKRVNFVI